MEEAGGGQSPADLVEDRHLGPIPSKSPPEAEADLHPAEYLRRFRLTHDRTRRKEGDRTAQERGRVQRDGRDRPELKSIKVTGTSGLSYLVTPGNGGHGSRFSVWPTGRNRAADAEAVRGRGHSPPICIVETRDLKRLVAGDAVSSVVMALLDDMSSRRRIDTLRNHISRSTREEEGEGQPRK